MICGHCHGKIREGTAGLFAHWRGECHGDPRWDRVLELRAEGAEAAADRLVRRILGVGEPMDEGSKARLRAYREAHAEEIADRRRVKALARKRLGERMEADRRALERRRRVL